METNSLSVNSRQHRHHRETADKLGDESETQQVLRLDALEDFLPVDDGGGRRALFHRAKAHHVLAQAALDDALQADEGAAADKQDVAGVHADVFLLGVLAAALRGHVAEGALENLEQGLLDPFPGHVPRDRDVLRLARDLVNLININNAPLRALDVVIRVLEQPQDDVLDVFADVAGLGQGRGVGDGEGHIQDFSQCAGQEGLAGAGGADHQDVAFLDLDIRVGVVRGGAALGLGSRFGRFLEDALVMVVDGHGEGLLGVVLADATQVELALDFGRLGHLEARFLLPGLRGEFLVQDLFAENDAVVADVNAGSGNELLDLGVRLAAKTAQRDVGGARHRN